MKNSTVTRIVKVRFKGNLFKQEFCHFSRALCNIHFLYNETFKQKSGVFVGTSVCHTASMPRQAKQQSDYQTKEKPPN